MSSSNETHWQRHRLPILLAASRAGCDNQRVGINQRLARTGDVADRIPAWDEFAGPQTGVVELPNRLYWSGAPAFDVENPPRRLTLYTTLIGDGQRADLARWVNRDLLVRDWPKIRLLTARVLVGAWERLLPELATA